MLDEKLLSVGAAARSSVPSHPRFPARASARGVPDERYSDHAAACRRALGLSLVHECTMKLADRHLIAWRMACQVYDALAAVARWRGLGERTPADLSTALTVQPRTVASLTPTPSGRNYASRHFSAACRDAPDGVEPKPTRPGARQQGLHALPTSTMRCMSFWPSMAAEMSTVPPGTESAPWRAALLASSCSMTPSASA